jgi:hypothetical protein
MHSIHSRRAGQVRANAAPAPGDNTASVLRAIRWLAWGAVAATLCVLLAARLAEPTRSTHALPDIASASCACAHNPETF